MATSSTPNGSTNSKDGANSVSKSFFRRTVNSLFNSMPKFCNLESFYLFIYSFYCFLSSVKKVCLKEWWLVKPEKDSEGKGLAVAGIASRGNQAVRVFSSAPILRRHDVFTLETVDEIFIIIKGFLNKARTEANGFPSEVCNHFVFGFPPDWESYALNYLGGEPLTMDATQSITDSGSLSPQEGKATEAPEREPSPRDSLVENMKSFEMSEDRPGDSVRQPLGPSGLEENNVPLSKHNNVKDHRKDNYDSSPHILRSPSDCKGKIFVSPCHTKEIKDSNSLSKAIEEPRKVKLRKRSSGEMEVSKEISRADDIADYFEGTRSTHSLSKLQRKWKDNSCGHGLQSKPQSSFLTTKARGSEEIAKCNIVKGFGARSNTILLVNGLQDLGDQMILRTPDSRSTEDDAGQEHRISYTGEGANGDQNNKRLTKQARKSNKALHSSRGFCNAGNRRKNNAGACERNITKHTNFYREKARRTYETRSSCKKKDKSSIASPESLSLNRSRSGRLLLPTLEFWRNQRAIYDADGQVTGVKDLQVNEPTKGSRSEPQREKKTSEPQREKRHVL